MSNSKIEIENNTYEIEKNERECFNIEEFKEKVTDYFFDFDYIFGDYAYDKLRLKGYYSSKNSKVTDINNIDHIEQYIKNYCVYGAKYFLLKKIK